MLIVIIDAIFTPTLAPPKMPEIILKRIESAILRQVRSKKKARMRSRNGASSYWSTTFCVVIISMFFIF
jgi:hypothetical protein